MSRIQDRVRVACQIAKLHERLLESAPDLWEKYCQVTVYEDWQRRVVMVFLDRTHGTSIHDCTYDSAVIAFTHRELVMLGVADLQQLLARRAARAFENWQPVQLAGISDTDKAVQDSLAIQ